MKTCISTLNRLTMWISYVLKQTVAVVPSASAATLALALLLPAGVHAGALIWIWRLHRRQQIHLEQRGNWVGITGRYVEWQRCFLRRLKI